MDARVRKLVVAVLLSALLSGACDLQPSARPTAAARITCAPLALSSPSTPISTGKIRFSGIVRNAQTCAAVTKVQVAAYEAQGGALTISSIDFATTDVSGLFELVVPSGQYRILFIPPAGSGLASRWWIHELSYLRATPLDGERAGLDMLLPQGFTISGNVITDTGAPLQAGVVVSPATDYYDWVTATSTDGRGHYTTTVPAGDFRLHFLTGPPWASQWWDNRSSHDEADDVIVAKDVTDISVMLRPGRIVSGRVTYSDSRPAEGALAFAMLPTTTRWCCEFAGTAYTDSDGRFRIALPEGTYRVGFAFDDGEGRLYALWWPGSGTDMDRSSPVVVDRDRNDLDLELP